MAGSLQRDWFWLTYFSNMCRCHGLESDVATLLSGWGATVHLTCDIEDAASSAATVLDFVTARESLGTGVVVTHVTLPLPTEADFFWCHKVMDGEGMASCSGEPLRLCGYGSTMPLGP